MPERLAQAMKLTNARTDSNRLDRLNLANDFKIFMHLVRIYCPVTSYSGFFIPISHLSNQPTICSSRSMRCQGCPERESSCVSPGKRTITVGIFLYLSARNISSPPAYVGVRQSASPRMNIIGVFTLLM